MKQLFLFLLLTYAQSASLQTLTLEQQNLQILLQNKQINKQVYTNRLKELDVIAPQLPAIPYDTVLQSFVLKHTITLAQGMPEHHIKQVKTWAALYFGPVTSVIHYEEVNEKNGTLILRGTVDFRPTLNRFDLKQWPTNAPYQMFFTMKCSITEQSLDIECRNMGYVSLCPQYLRTDPAVASCIETIHYFGHLFPLTTTYTGDWQERLRMIQAMQYELNRQFKLLEYTLQTSE